MVTRKVWMAGIAGFFQLFNLLLAGFMVWVGNVPLYAKIFLAGLFSANITILYIIYDYISMVSDEEGEKEIEELYRDDDTVDETEEVAP